VVSGDNLVFLKSFEKIFKKYEIVRNALILPGKISEYNKVHLAPLNEFRNALFHIFKSLENNKNIEYEHNAALVHYTRAQYDAFEIFINENVLYINTAFNDYDCETVNDIFCKYYDEILPKINELKYSLTVERTQRRKDTEKATELIFDKFEMVADFVSEIDEHKKLLPEETKKRKRKKSVFFLKGSLLALLTGIAVGLIGAICYVLFNK